MHIHVHMHVHVACCMRICLAHREVGDGGGARVGEVCEERTGGHRDTVVVGYRQHLPWDVGSDSSTRRLLDT